MKTTFAFLAILSVATANRRQAPITTPKNNEVKGWGLESDYTKTVKQVSRAVKKDKKEGCEKRALWGVSSVHELEECMECGE